MATKIRSSNQLYVDTSLDVNAQKIVNLAAGTVAGNAVEYAQMNAAINNAIAGAGNSIHEPVADLTAIKAITVTDTLVNGVVTVGGRTDKMILLVEALGLYRFDAESLAVSNDGSVIRPTDVASDAAAGRWLKMSSILTDHSLLDNILGNGGYHLSLAERDKLTGIEAGADVTDAGNVGAAIAGAPTKAAPVDADEIAMVDSAASWSLKSITWASIKATLKTYFDPIYQAALGYTAENVANKDASGGYAGLTLFKINFKNVANTFTSFFTNSNTAARTYTFPDRTGTIADDTDITGAKARANHTGTQLASTISDFNASALAAAPAETATTIGNLINAAAQKATPVDTDMIAVMDSAASNVVKKMSFANLKSLWWAAITGDVTISAAGVATIGALKVATGMIAANAVDNTKLAQMATMTIKGNNTGGAANPADLTVVQVKTMLGLTAQAGQTRTYNAVPTGTIDGVNANFNIAALCATGSVVVYKNGLRQNPGAGNDYTVNTAANPAVITFLTGNIPIAGTYPDVILVDYSA